MKTGENMNTKTHAACIFTMLSMTQVAFANAEASDTISGTLAPVNEISVVGNDALALTGGTNASPDGAFTPEIFSVTISNNHTNGYTVSMKSSNGGLLKASGSADTDGDFLDLLWSCTDPTGPNGEVIVTTNNANQNLVTDTYADVINVSNPSVATANSSFTCTPAIDTSDAANLLLTTTGNVIYSTMITFKIANNP